LEAAIVHSTEDGAVLDTVVASVQELENPILGTDELRTTAES
jgi:hypothetical protein